MARLFNLPSCSSVDTDGLLLTESEHHNNTEVLIQKASTKRMRPMRVAASKASRAWRAPVGDASSRPNQIAPASVRPDGEGQHLGSKRRQTETPSWNAPASDTSRPTAAGRKKVIPKSAGPNNAWDEAQSNLPSFPSELMDVFRGGGTSLADNQDNFTALVKFSLENLAREGKPNGLSHDLDQYHASKYPCDPAHPFVVDGIIKELQ